MASRLFATLGCVLLAACFEPVGGPLRDAAEVGKDVASSHDSGARDAAADAPDVGGGDDAGELPDAGSDAPDASSPDACTPETDSQLCSTLGLTCGPGRGIDLCGVVRDVDCGPCGTLPLCGPGVTAPCERICSWLGYCWAYPQPMGGSVSGIDGVAADDVWIVGGFGATLHWDGTSLKRVDSGTGAGLTGVKAFSSTEVWATGVVAGGINDIKGPATIRWNGTGWASPNGNLGPVGMTLWGSSPSDIWIDKNYHWDGTSWSSNLGGIGMFATMWGSTSNDVWYYEGGISLFHYDGAIWRPTPPAPMASWRAFGGIAGTSTSDVWMGSGNLFARWDGSAWTPASPPSDSPMTGAFARGQDVWVLFGNELFHHDGAGWNLALTLPAGEHAQRMWTDGTEFWFGRPGLLRWDGQQFTSFREAATPTVWRAWGSAADLWSVSKEDATLHHWDGTGWAPFDMSSLAGKLHEVSGSSSTNVWAVGEAGAILLWNGAHWSAASSGTTADLWHVVATADDDAWAAGESNVLLHWDGLAWSHVASPTTASIRSLWGSSREDVWAVDGSSTLARFDGTGWSTVAAPCRSIATFLSVWGTSPEDVWAFGEARTGPGVVTHRACHWDGSNWAEFDVGGEHTRGCGSPTRGFIFDDWGSLAAWDGDKLEILLNEPIFDNEQPRACAIDHAGDLWLFLSDGSVLQRSGRWR